MIILLLQLLGESYGLLRGSSLLGPFLCPDGLLFSLLGIKCTINTLTMIEKKYFKTKDYCKVKFNLEVEAKKVEILGLNGEWKKGLVMTKKKDGSFSIDVNLPKDSQHEFKYLVDKKNWITDPASEATQNVFGTTNSVLSI
jgi:hypothetical protein